MNSMVFIICIIIVLLSLSFDILGHDMSVSLKEDKIFLRYVIVKFLWLICIMLDFVANILKVEGVSLYIINLLGAILAIGYLAMSKKYYTMLKLRKQGIVVNEGGITEVSGIHKGQTVYLIGTAENYFSDVVETTVKFIDTNVIQVGWHNVSINVDDIGLKVFVDRGKAEDRSKYFQHVSNSSEVVEQMKKSD